MKANHGCTTKTTSPSPASIAAPALERMISARSEVAVPLPREASNQ